MVKYKDRQYYVEARETHAEGDYTISPAPHWNPPIATVLQVPYYTPRFSRYLERFWEDDLATWDNGWFNHHNHDRRLREDLRIQTTWKPCQHYICYLDTEHVKEFTDPLLANVTPWKNESATAIGSYITHSKGVNPLLVVDSPVFTATFGQFGQHYAGLTPMCVDQKDQSFVPVPNGLSSLVEMSLKAMLPKVKASMSTINNIIELKDFKTLPHTIVNMIGTGRNLLKFVKNGKKSLGPGPLSLVRKTFDPSQGLTLRELTNTGADGFLQAEFNIMPLLSDLVETYKAFYQIHKKMNRLLANEGRPQKRHWSPDWLAPQFSDPNTTKSYALNLGQFAGYYNPSGQTGCYRALQGSIEMTRTVEVMPATFHAEIEYCYNFTQYQREHAEVLYLLDTLGINLNPAIIWNAIPWSFLIDWFIDISRYLGNRKVLNMEPRVSISRYLWSWTQTRKIRMSFRSPANESGGRISVTYLPDLYETIYRRDVQLPSFTNSLYGSGFSGIELSLGAALVTTRAFHPNRRLRVK